MQTVIVTNNSGIRLNFMGKRIKSLRDFKGEQPFSFKTCADALKFEAYITEHPAKGLTALYSPKAEDLAAEGITLTTESEVSEDAQEQIAALAAKLEAGNSKAELQTLAATLELADYEDLNKGPLAELIAKAQLATEGNE